jgi:hypothetical protein
MSISSVIWHIAQLFERGTSISSVIWHIAQLFERGMSISSVIWLILVIRVSSVIWAKPIMGVIWDFRLVA